jgi:hypothetical protein
VAPWQQAITAILQPSACVLQPPTPPPIEVLLKAKAQPQFGRAVDRTVEAIFHVFQRSNRVQFQPDFSVFAVPIAAGCEEVYDSI